jgi:hypothetical protein
MVTRQQPMVLHIRSSLGCGRHDFFPKKPFKVVWARADFNLD